jgi:hypothetical protein
MGSYWVKITDEVETSYIVTCFERGLNLLAGVNFINVIRTHFSYEIFGVKTSNPKASFVVFGAKNNITLMKLTADNAFLCKGPFK